MGVLPRQKSRSTVCGLILVGTSGVTFTREKPLHLRSGFDPSSRPRPPQGVPQGEEGLGAGPEAPSPRQRGGGVILNGK